MSASGAGEREYSFTSTWLTWVGGIAAALVAWVGLHVHGHLTGTPPFDGWAYLPLGLLVGAVMAWVVARNLVRSATLDGRRLRARTLLGTHDVALDTSTALAWQVAEARVGSLNPLNTVTARIRAGRRTFRVPMPAGAGLIRDLEAAGADHAPARGGAPGAGGAREFDFTSWAETGWALHDTVIQHATLDDRCLRAVTVDGRDHVIALADIDEVDHDRRRDGGEVLVRHPGGALRIPMPSGAELADRLSAAVPGR